MRTKTYHSELIKRPGSLDILQSLLQTSQLGFNFALGLLSILDGLGLKSINCLQLPTNIVRGGSEALETALDLVDHSLVLEGLTIGAEVDVERQFGKLLQLASGVIVALLEGLKGGGGLAAEAERGGDLGPVDFECGTALFARVNKNRR